MDRANGIVEMMDAASKLAPKKNYGEFEEAALKRELGRLWVRRTVLDQEEGRRLDTLIRVFGRPDDSWMGGI